MPAFFISRFYLISSNVLSRRDSHTEKKSVVPRLPVLSLFLQYPHPMLHLLSASVVSFQFLTLNFHFQQIFQCIIYTLIDKSTATQIIFCCKVVHLRQSIQRKTNCNLFRFVRFRNKICHIEITSCQKSNFYYNLQIDLFYKFKINFIKNLHWGDFMKQTIYCDCFYCEHYEDSKCLSPELHLGFQRSCKEFVHSQKKLDAYFDSRDPDFDPNRPKEYGEYDPPAPKAKILRLRQK